MALMNAAAAALSNGSFSFRMTIGNERDVWVDELEDIGRLVRHDPEVGGERSSYLLVAFDHSRDSINLFFDALPEQRAEGFDTRVMAQQAGEALMATGGILSRLCGALATLGPMAEGSDS